MEPYQPSGIYSLLQDLYTTQEYNPAEYTLLGYDTEAYLGGVPVGSYDMTAATGPQGEYYTTEAQGAMTQDLAAQNAAVKAAAAANLEEARARGDIFEWDPSMGISSMPKERQVGFAGYDAEGLIYDEKGRGYDVLGRIMKDEYGRGTGFSAHQWGLTPEMAARGYTLGDVVGP